MISIDDILESVQRIHAKLWHEPDSRWKCVEELWALEGDIKEFKEKLEKEARARECFGEGGRYKSSKALIGAE